jgi:hypothetical protein
MQHTANNTPTQTLPQKMKTKNLLAEKTQQIGKQTRTQSPVAGKL